MEADRNEAGFEALASIPNELITGEAAEQFDSNVTHAMITADGTTVPITLNPETGQFMTSDGQMVQVQMATEEQEYGEEAETVLPDDAGADTSFEQSSFQVVTSDIGQATSTVTVKDESYAALVDQTQSSGQIQLISSDGSMVTKSPSREESEHQL
jgi:hypothetical protein